MKSTSEKELIARISDRQSEQRYIAPIAGLPDPANPLLQKN